MGEAVFPPCSLAWGQAMVGVMVVMVTFFRRIYAKTVVFSAPDPKADHCRPMPPLETPEYSQASLAQSLVRLAPWKKSYDQTRQHIKKQSHYFADKGPSSQSYGFSSGHVWMWEQAYKESWAPKNWCFWTVVLEKMLESPLDSKEIQQVHPKGNQSWIFIGRTDAEAETPIIWPDAKNWHIRKDPDAGKDWRQEEKGMTEDEMVGWHHQLDGHGLEQALGVGDRQGGLACCSPWGHKESDTTDRLNWNTLVDLNYYNS